MMHKRCAACGETKDLAEWYENRAAYDGLGSYCKACTNKKSDEKRRTPEDKNKPQNRAKWADGMMRAIRPKGKDY